MIFLLSVWSLTNQNRQKMTQMVLEKLLMSMQLMTNQLRKKGTYIYCAYYSYTINISSKLINISFYFVSNTIHHTTIHHTFKIILILSLLMEINFHYLLTKIDRSKVIVLIFLYCNIMQVYVHIFHFNIFMYA